MQAMTTTAVVQAAPGAANHCPVCACTEGGHSINPRTLVNLDFGMFRALCRLGTSRERICSALNISSSDFDYLTELSAT